MQTGLGVITVTTPGTRVGILTNVVSTQYIGAQSILLQALSNATHTNSGRVYVYVTDSTGTAKRVATLAVPGTNSIPSFSATIPNATAAMNPAAYSIDADNSGDGVDASYLVP